MDKCGGTGPGTEAEQLGRWTKRDVVVAMKVLLIEDEPFLADTMRRGLSEHGHAVDLARDGTLGLELALSHRYHAILLDIMLPGMHGDRVLQELRAREVRTPVIVLTAGAGEYARAQALDLGADDFLAKPFSFVVLLSRLADLTRASAEHNSTQPAVTQAHPAAPPRRPDLEGGTAQT